MNSCRWWKKLAVSYGAALLAISATLGAQTTPTSTVATPTAPQTVTVTITAPGAVASIAIVTQGSANLDFKPASSNAGTCTVGAVYNAADTCTVQYVFTPAHPFTRYGAVVLYDATGNVLGNTFLIGTGNGAQVGYPLGPNSVTTANGSGFLNPSGVAVDAAGNMYVADTGNNAVKEIPFGGGTPVTLGSGFQAPRGVAVDGAGNVYVADTGDGQVKEIVATNGAVPASTPTVIRTLATNYTFSSPQGIAVDGYGNVYVADKGNAVVVKILAADGVIPPTTSTSPNSPTVNTLAGTYTMPSGVAVDAAGNVFVADAGNSGIVEIPVSGAGNLTLGSGLTAPQSVAVDGLGNVYVSSTGAVTELLAVNGSVPASGATTVVLGNSFTGPTGVAVDAVGNVYVADTSSTALAELAQTTPSLTFTVPTAVGLQSSDSPKSITIQNIGNAALTVPVPATGTNPLASAGFTLATGTCPQVSSTDTTPGSLAGGATCTYGVNFVPATAGTPAGSLVLTDNNLGANNTATQSFTLAGTSTLGTPQVTVSPQSITAGTSTVTLSASVSFGGSAPGGQFTFTVSSGSTILGSVNATCPGTTSPLSCSATYDPSSLLVGSYTIQGTIAADSNYNSASSAGQLVVNQATPTVTLSSSPASPAVDSQVTLTAQISPNTGTILPTGKVSFATTLNGSTSPIAGCGAITPTAGIAVCNTTGFRAGTNSVVATIASDTNFVSASSSAATVTVTAAATSLTITSSQAASTVNQPVTFTATLSASSSFTVTPTGSVKFTSNGNIIPGCDNQALGANQTATCTAYALVAPADGISAVYTSGDANFTGSTTTQSFLQTVGMATPTNALNSSQTTAASVNQTVTFTVMVTPPNSSSNGVTPTGSAIFYNGAAQLCAPVVLSPGGNGTGTASCSAAFSTVSPGGLNIRAVYSGDSSFTVGNSAAVTQVVSASATSIAPTNITTTPSTPAVNGSTTLKAVVTPAFSGSTSPGGTIQFTDSYVDPTTSNPITSTACSATVTNGSASCAYTFSAAAVHTIKATYSGDTNFSGSANSNSVTVVAAGANTINISSTTPRVTVNQSATYTASFSSTGQTAPTGTYQYYDSVMSMPNQIANCGGTLPSSGLIPSCTEVLLSAGTHVITVAYTSNSSSFTSVTSGGFNETVDKNSTATNLTISPSSSTADQIVTFNAVVTPTAVSTTPGATTTAAVLTAPSGPVTISYKLNGVSTNICTPTVSTNNGVYSASCNAQLPSAGSYAITAVYNGDANFIDSTGSNSQLVGKTGVTLTTVAGSSFSTPGAPSVNQAAALSVQLALANGITISGGSAPSGNVVFKDAANSSIACTAPITTSGQASCPLTEVTVGNHNITATYSGDNNFDGTVASFQLTVNASPTTISAASIFTNPSTPAVNSSVALNASLTPTYTGTAVPTGKVSFYDTLPNGTQVLACTSTLDSAGVVTACPYVFGTAGSHSITANYSGDSSFGSTAATPITLTVTQALPTLTLVSASPVSIATQQVSFTATVTPPPSTVSASGAPSGTVTFNFPQGSISSSSCSSAPVALSSSGTATCVVTFATYAASGTGTYNVTATYSGDTNYITTQRTIAQNVQSYTQNLAPGSVAFGAGDSNNTDPYSTASSITYTLSAQNAFSNNTTSSCSSSPAVTGLTCNLVPPTFSLGASAQVVISATTAVAPGVYTLNVVTKDNNSALQQSTPLSVTVIGRVFPAGSSTPYSVSTSGQVAIPLTLPAVFAGSTYTCNSNVANVGSNGTYSQTGNTLSNLGLTCTVAGSGTNYTVSIVSGSGGSAASIRPSERAGRGELLVAGLSTPFFLLLGVSSSNRKLRKAMMRISLVLLLTAATLYSTGCSSGGFIRGSNPTYGVGGSYLIGINNASGTKVAEVPLLVTGNGAGL